MPNTSSNRSAHRFLQGVRFAPSPTGRFHIGNLRTAWISEKLARLLGQTWVVRVEDLDPLRSQADFWKTQHQDLERLGLRADLIVWQRQRLPIHQQSLQQAYEEGRIYPCTCSRREVLEGLASAPHGPEAVYNGKCRKHPPQQLNSHVGWRWKSADDEGHRDPLVARGDLAAVEPAYHWACAIDDADGGYQLLVRAIDLLPAEAIQRAIRIWRSPELGDKIRVFHTSLVVHNDGSRLEKRSQGVTLDELKISTEQLLQNFERSFDQAAALASLRQAAIVQRETPPLIREAASQVSVGSLLSLADT